MEEAKVRLNCIASALRGETGYPVPIVREFGYLQLRLLCELVALSCLTAHGDIAQLIRGATYSADDILKRLTDLRPHFYPSAYTQAMKPGPGPKRTFTLTPKDPQPLPKEQLLALYGTCHAHLHRGRFKHLLSASTPVDRPPNLPEIASWAQRIADMLSVHRIAISDETGLVCILHNKDDEGKVQVATYARTASA
jgi:hypothetical protein